MYCLLVAQGYVKYGKLEQGGRKDKKITQDWSYAVSVKNNVTL